MNITLFLGSGISRDSGYPTVEALTDSILKKNTSEAKFLCALRDYDNKARALGGTYINKNQYVQVGEAFRKTTSYEDLYYLCSEIASFDYGLHGNAMVPAFMESLADELAPILKERSKNKQLLEIGRYAHAAIRCINSTVTEKLGAPDKILGLDLVLHLANNPKVSSLNIITLNHDLLIEQLLLRNGVEFDDGFGDFDGDVRWFEPDRLLSETKVKIIKLHGSVDWFTFSGGEKIGKIFDRSVTELFDSKGRILKLESTIPKVLSGLNKINQYNVGIYTDIHYHFQRVLYQSKTIVMSGYGWGDEPINNRLMTWIDKRSENRLILLHKELQLLTDRSLILLRDYSNWAQQGKLVLIPKWLSEVEMKEVLEHAELA